VIKNDLVNALSEMDYCKSQVSIVINDIFKVIAEALVEGEKVTRLSDDEAIKIDDLKEKLEHYDGKIVFVGDGAELCYAALHDKLENICLAPSALRLQSAYGVALAAMKQPGESADDLVPNYLRLSQAERERNERLQGS